MARKPSIEAHQKVLKSAGMLFATRGIDATSMDAIAAESGVSKATIYKHWKDKDALLLEVVSVLHGGQAEAAAKETDDVRADLVATLSHRMEQEQSECHERMIPHVIAYALRNPTFGKSCRTQMVEHQRAQFDRLLQRGIDNGTLRSDMNREVGIAMLFGVASYHRMQMQPGKGQVSNEFIEEFVEAFYRAFGNKK